MVILVSQERQILQMYQTGVVSNCSVVFIVVGLSERAFEIVNFVQLGLQINYRSGTVNSKSFVGKVLLRIKWKFELNNTL